MRCKMRVEQPSPKETQIREASDGLVAVDREAYVTALRLAKPDHDDYKMIEGWRLSASLIVINEVCVAKAVYTREVNLPGVKVITQYYVHPKFLN